MGCVKEHFVDLPNSVHAILVGFVHLAGCVSKAENSVRLPGRQHPENSAKSNNFNLPFCVLLVAGQNRDFLDKRILLVHLIF